MLLSIYVSCYIIFKEDIDLNEMVFVLFLPCYGKIPVTFVFEKPNQEKTSKKSKKISKKVLTIVDD